MKELYTLTIKADSRPGLLHLITGIIEKKLIRIVIFGLQATASDGTVMMTTTIMIDAPDLKNLVLKLENIIEVFSVAVSKNEMVTTADSQSYPDGELAAGTASGIT
jgi:uncharacterized protein with ACT and thioredoxin-like domain